MPKSNMVRTLRFNVLTALDEFSEIIEDMEIQPTLADAIIGFADTLKATFKETPPSEPEEKKEDKQEKEQQKQFDIIFNNGEKIRVTALTTRHAEVEFRREHPEHRHTGIKIIKEIKEEKK